MRHLVTRRRAHRAIVTASKEMISFMAMRIPYPNALTDGLFSSSFHPVEVGAKHLDSGPWRLLLAPIRPRDVAGLLASRSGPWFACFDHEGESDSEVEVKNLRAQQRRKNEIAEVTFAAVRKSDLRAFIGGLDGRFRAVDLAGDPSADALRKLLKLQAALELAPSTSMLALSEESKCAVTVADERRIEIDAAKPETLRACFSRFLQIYAGTALRRSGQPATDVAKVPSFVVDEFWHGDWSLSLGARKTLVQAGVVRAGFRKGRFGKVRQGAGEVDGWINYDGSAGRWSVSGNHPAKPKGKKTKRRESVE